jgi:antitoxin ParD1/3/4
MNVALQPEQEQFVRSQIDKGRFKSADEAVLQAFKLLEEKYKDYESWIEDTRQKVDVAVVELDRSEGFELDLVIDSLEERLRQRLQVKPSRRSLKDLGADLKVQITTADIDEARQEMWGNFPREIV